MLTFHGYGMLLLARDDTMFTLEKNISYILGQYHGMI